VSLQFNVLALLREPVGSVRHHAIAGDVLVDGTRQHVSGETTFLRTQDGVLVTGDLAGERQDICSRCLRDVSQSFEVEVRDEYVTTVDAHTGALIDPPGDPVALRIDAMRHTLDLQEAVRQALTAALPMQPLCRDECNGLCSRCGQDLNESDCACPPEADDRWSGLQALAKDMKGS